MKTARMVKVAAVAPSGLPITEIEVRVRVPGAEYVLFRTVGEANQMIRGQIRELVAYMNSPEWKGGAR